MLFARAIRRAAQAVHRPKGERQSSTTCVLNAGRFEVQLDAGTWAAYTVDDLPSASFSAPLSAITELVSKMPARDCSVRACGHRLETSTGSIAVGPAGRAVWPSTDLVGTGQVSEEDAAGWILAASRASQDALRPGFAAVVVRDGWIEAGDEAQVFRWSMPGLADCQVRAEGLRKARLRGDVQIRQAKQFLELSTAEESRLVRCVQGWQPDRASVFNEPPNASVAVPAQPLAVLLRQWKLAERRTLLLRYQQITGELCVRSVALNEDALIGLDPVQNPDGRDLEIVVAGDRLLQIARTWPTSTLEMGWRVGSYAPHWLDFATDRHRERLASMLFVAPDETLGSP